MTSRTALTELYARAMLQGKPYEAHTLAKEHRDWSPADGFGYFQALFNLAVFAEFGYEPDPDAMRTFLEKILIDGPQARPPVEPLLVQRLIDSAYIDDEGLYEVPQQERLAAIWLSLRALVPPETQEAALDRLIENAAELQDWWAEYDWYRGEAHIGWRTSARAAGLADWREEVHSPPETMTLWRPCGPAELELVRESGFTAWPPRLPDQPIFYPVLNEDYAVKIARDWNAPRDGVGYVTRFEVERTFARRYPVQKVGGRTILELWVPAEELDDFNHHIVGTIQVISEHRNSDSSTPTDEHP
jgi:hypothetical protein